MVFDYLLLFYINFSSSFSAPEVNSCNVTYKCDYYSIGLMIIYIFSGKIPNIYNINLEDYGEYSFIQPLCEKCIKEFLNYF